MDALIIVLITIEGLIPSLSLTSGWIEQTGLSRSLLALLIGIILSPAIPDIIDLADLLQRLLILEEVACVMLVMSIMIAEAAWILRNLLICTSVMVHGLISKPLSLFYRSRSSTSGGVYHRISWHT